ncbi:hypothetical protein HUB94_23455 (plasmid) [Paenibacillus cellulosilyticus]|nr:hypothetical protein HUB94_23455 [Paenibacillus cellulosilyticus]
MGFVEEHTRWLQHHLKHRSGERKGRLERGHGHGEMMFLERVWWQIFGNLDDLHPEYEVSDWRGRPYFLDLVWMPGDGRCKFAFEIKGFGPHVQQTDRIRYRQELNRETYLQVLGFKVIAIPYDDLAEQPALTISLLKMLLSPYLSSRDLDNGYSRLERDVLMLALRSNKPLRPIDLVEELTINRRTAVQALHSLTAKGRFRALQSTNGIRVKRYEYIHAFSDTWRW